MDAITKAFEILEVFLNTEDHLSITEIAKLANISTSTSHRITSILVNRGYIEQNGKRGKYSLNPKMLVYFAGIIRKRLRLRNIALPFLKELSHTVNEAVLIFLRHSHIIYTLEVVNSGRLLNITPDSTTFNLYSTGAGKVFLANMSEKELDEYFSSIILKPRTPNTITDVEELRRHLKRIKKDGFSFDDEEQELGLRMVSSPVIDWDNNVIAAIGVVGPTSRLSRQKMVEIAPTVKKYALEISQAIGYSQDQDSANTK